MTSVLEAIVLNLMVFTFSGERLYGQEPWTCARCAEQVDGNIQSLLGALAPMASMSALAASTATITGQLAP